MKKSVIFGALTVAGLAAGAAAAGTLDDVKARGKLNCGVTTGLVGFAAPDANGNWDGFDVGVCRAVAAAVLGDPAAVEFVPTTGKTRFTALASGEIDIPDDATPEEEERILRTAMAMPVDKATTFQTGGDVSRFQRKTLPEDEEAARRREKEAERAAKIAQQRALAAARASGRNLTGNGQPGPVVRVIRGRSAREVPVGGAAGAPNGAAAQQLLNTQARGLNEAGKTAPAAAATLIK